jgi:hypothetical protein
MNFLTVFACRCRLYHGPAWEEIYKFKGPEAIMENRLSLDISKSRNPRYFKNINQDSKASLSRILQ